MPALADQLGRQKTHVAGPAPHIEYTHARFDSCLSKKLPGERRKQTALKAETVQFPRRMTESILDLMSRARYLR